MVRTIIGGVEVQDYIEGDGSYRIEVESVDGGNGFTDVSGVEISDKIGDKIILSLNLTDVPDSVGAQLAEAVSAATFPVVYTTPARAARLFKLNSYTAENSDSDPEQEDYEITENMLWNISMKIESVDYAVPSSGL